jgi:hypothetical protein
MTELTKNLDETADRPRTESGIAEHLFVQVRGGFLCESSTAGGEFDERRTPIVGVRSPPDEFRGLVWCTWSRLPIVRMGKEPLRLRWSSISTSYLANEMPKGLRTVSTRARAIWWARIREVIAAMPGAASAQPWSSQCRVASAIGSVASRPSVDPWVVRCVMTPIVEERWTENLHRCQLVGCPSIMQV